MTAVCITQRVQSISRRPLQAPAHREIALSMHLYGTDSHTVLLPARGEHVDALASKTLELETAAIACVPVAAQGQLYVEAGTVEQSVIRAGQVLAQRIRAYVLTRRGDMLMMLRSTPGAKPPTVKIGTEMLQASKLEPSDADLPVVLGPSAGLALILYGSAANRKWPDHRSIPVTVEPIESPYPPHTTPLGLLNGAADHGTAAGCLERYRSLRPERWPCPAQVLDAEGCSSMRVGCARRHQMPTRAVVIDALLALSDAMSGMWQVQVSKFHAPRAISAVVEPLRLNLDAWQTLASVCAAVGPDRAAAVYDPLTGPSYGFAPPMLISPTWGEMR